MIISLEAVFFWFFAKLLFLKTLQNSQENACNGVSFLIKLQAVGAISTSNLRYTSMHFHFAAYKKI